MKRKKNMEMKNLGRKERNKNEAKKKDVKMGRGKGGRKKMNEATKGNKKKELAFRSSNFTQNRCFKDVKFIKYEKRFHRCSSFCFKNSHTATVALSKLKNFFFSLLFKFLTVLI